MLKAACASRSGVDRVLERLYTTAHSSRSLDGAQQNPGHRFPDFIWATALQKKPPAHFFTQGKADALTEQGEEEPGCPGSNREDKGRSRVKTPTVITPAKRALTAPQFHSLEKSGKPLKVFGLCRRINLVEYKNLQYGLLLFDKTAALI